MVAVTVTLLLILGRALLLVFPVRHCLVHHLALLLIDCVTPAKMYNMVRNNGHLKLVLFNTARVKNRPAFCPREFVALFPRPNILRGGGAKQCLFIFRESRWIQCGSHLPSCIALVAVHFEHREAFCVSRVGHFCHIQALRGLFTLEVVFAWTVGAWFLWLHL